MVLTTLDSDRALLLVEYLSCTRTIAQAIIVEWTPAKAALESVSFAAFRSPSIQVTD